MKVIKSLDQIPDVEYRPVIVEMLSGEEVNDLNTNMAVAQGQLEAIERVINQVEHCGTAQPEAMTILSHIKDNELAPLVGSFQERIESENYAQFNVRPMLPKEQFVLANLGNIPQPVPPLKKEEVTPLDTAGRIDPTQVHDKQYVDINDPGYLAAMREYNAEMERTDERAMAFMLYTCVEGFDLTDVQIKEFLGEDAHPKEPADSFRKRLDQIGAILLTRIEIRFVDHITSAIKQMSGVSNDRINFTSRGSSRLS
jgi:hypothetical protein